MKVHRILLTLIALVLALSIPGLVGEPAQAQTISGGFLRVTHASVGAPNVDIYLGGNQKPAVANLPFGESSDLLELGAGTYTVSVRPAGGGPASTLLTARVAVPRRGIAELVALGRPDVRAGRLAFRLGRYPLDLRSTNKARVYVVHASPNVGPVDVLAGGTPVVRRLAYSEGTLVPVEVDAGTYDLKVVPTGRKEPVYLDLRGTKLRAGEVYTIIATGTQAGLPVFLRAIAQREAPTPPAPTGFVRVTHASPGAPNVDIYLDGGNTPAIANLAYGKSTDFIELPAKEYAVAIRAAGSAANSAPVFETKFTLPKGASFEVVALGVLGGEPAFNVKLFPVKRTATGGKARVYVLHASPTTKGVDIKVNGAPTLTNFGFGAFTEKPLEVDPGTYNVTGVATGTASPVLISLVGLQLKANTIYTIIARGDLRREQPLNLTSAPISDAAAGLTGFVRVTHASPGAPAVDIYLDGSPVAAIPNLAFSKSTGWIELTAKEYNVELRPAGASPVTPPVYEQKIKLGGGVSAEVVAMGILGGRPGFGLKVFPIDRSFPNGRVRVYAIHAAPGGPAVDIRVNGELASIGLAYGSYTATGLNYDAGPTNVAITRTARRSPVLASLVQTELAANTVYTIIAYGRPLQSKPLVLTSTFPANVRIVHASPGAPAVDIYLDDSTTPAVTKLEFGKATDLITLQPKDYKVAIRAAGSAADSAPAFETTLTIVSGGSAEVVALGILGGEPAFRVGVFPVSDSATRGKVRVYAIHAAPKAPAVDVYVNGAVVVPGLTFPKYTATALEVDPGIFNVAVTPAGQRSPVVTQLTQVELKANTIYTVIAYGNPVASKPLVLTRSPR